MSCGDDDVVSTNIGGVIQSPNEETGTGSDIVSDIYDCKSDDSQICDSIACPVESSSEVLDVACGLPLAPPNCAAFRTCLANYTSCINSACPAGAALSEANQSEINTCYDTYTQCSKDVTGT